MPQSSWPIDIRFRARVLSSRRSREQSNYNISLMDAKLLCESKREEFRVAIRRKHNDAMIKEGRKRFLESILEGDPI